MAFHDKISRRDFLKLFGAGATTLALGSILGFSSLLPAYNNKSGRGPGNGTGSGVQQAARSVYHHRNLCSWSKHWKYFNPRQLNIINGKIFYARRFWLFFDK